MDAIRARAEKLADNAEWVFGRRATRVLGVVVLFAVVVTLLLVFLNWYVAPTKPSEKKDLVLALAQILAGTALLSGLYFTWRTLQVNREGQITERFTRAIDQLGKTDDKGNKLFEIRLGGIYALERIAMESEEDYWPVMDVLTAYVRHHARGRPEEDQHGAKMATVENSEEDSKGESEPTEGPTPDPDIQAIMTVLGRRTRSLGYREPEALDLHETNLERANLERANLERADLEGANLRAAKLVRTVFNAADLTEADLTNAGLEAASLTDAILSRANFTEAILAGAYLFRADLKGANFTEAILSGATIWEADLSRANLKGAELLGANLRRATLTETILKDAHLAEADLTKANLTEADLTNAHIWKANLTEANLMGVKVTETDIMGADFPESNLERANLMGANLRKANFKAVNLKDADLSGVDLSGTTFYHADSSGAVSVKAGLSGTNLRGANLGGANLLQEQLNKAKGDEDTRLPYGLKPPTHWGVTSDEQIEED